jgi:16S rRNA (guanine966-N2)-methyltransferase
VREALFSMLDELAGQRVLDLYAGTGALGIEALSRGAARAVFVENARPALAALRENIAALGIEEEALPVRADLPRPALRGARGGPRPHGGARGARCDRRGGARRRRACHA